MSVFSRLAAVFRLCVRKSAAERSLEQAVKSVRPSRILAIGLPEPDQTRRLIELAQRYATATIQFTGIDLFEERPNEDPPFPLKEAYCLLRTTGARIRLIPGDAQGALIRAANTISGVELVVISQAAIKSSLNAAWFYLPRTLAPNAVVLWADNELAESEYRQVPHSELLQAARSLRSGSRRAA